MSSSTSPAPMEQAQFVSSPSSEHDTATSTIMNTESLLSYPSGSASAFATASSSGLTQAQQQQPEPRTRTLLKDRLYIGNLSHTVDEHALIQIFSKFGKLSNLDYLFHKSGPLKGKPRGYAFVEYASQTDAERALQKTNNKLLRGRRLVVTFAHQAPMDAFPGGGAGGGYRRNVNEAGRPTALSLLKSAQGDRTKDKIALMEAKLRQLEKESTPIPSPSSATSTSSPITSLPHHPSLPAKPPPQSQGPAPAHASRLPSSSRPGSSSATPRSIGTIKSSAKGPPKIDVGLGITMGKSLGLGSSSGGVKKSGAGVKGVKIVKKKGKEKEKERSKSASAEEPDMKSDEKSESAGDKDVQMSGLQDEGEQNAAREGVSNEGEGGGGAITMEMGVDVDEEDRVSLGGDDSDLEAL